MVILGVIFLLFLFFFSIMFLMAAAGSDIREAERRKQSEQSRHEAELKHSTEE